MKKKIFALIALFGSLNAISITSCSKDNNNKLNNDVLDLITTTKDGVTNIQSLTAVNLLSFIEKVTIATPYSLNNLKVVDNTLLEETKNKIIDILPTLDLLLAEDLNYESTIVNEENVINGTTFLLKETLSYQNNSFTKSEITFYYNVTKESSWTEIDHDDKEEEFKSIKVSNGYALLNESLFPFNMIIGEESENGESEVSKKFKIETGVNSYILVEDEKEEERGSVETELSYKIVENGRKVNEYSISIEKEGNKEKLSYELDNEEYELTKRTINNEEVFIVEYEKEDRESEYEVTLMFVKRFDQNGNVYFEEYIR